MKRVVPALIVIIAILALPVPAQRPAHRPASNW